MALRITRENMGVVFTPRDEEVYSNSSGVLYPRVIELHHAGDLNGILLATFDHSTVKEPPVVPVMSSSDGGVTWEKYSQIEDTENGFGLVTSADGGKTWSGVEYIVTVPDRAMRPGMPVVSQMGNGKFIMVYEIVGKPCCDIYYKLSDDGVNWGDPLWEGKRVETPDGLFLGSMPYVIWVPQGGKCGTVIVTAKREGEHIGMRDPGFYHVNYEYGTGEWHRIPMLITYNTDTLQAGWSMGMTLMQNDKLIQLAPTPINRRLMQITYGIGKLETTEK